MPAHNGTALRPRTDVKTPTEAYIHAYGIQSRAYLDAAMLMTDKSPALLGRLILTIVTGHLTRNHDDGDAMLSALMGEPALDARGLREMAQSMRGRGGTTPDILTAICTHPRVDPYTVIDALWKSPQPAAQAVARAGGSLLPAAINWVGRQVDAKTAPGLRLGSPDNEQSALIRALTSAWATRCEGNHALGAFIANAAFSFTDENELFAAGYAISAPPGA